MKKFTAIAAFVLTMALVLCSFLMPAATTATGSGSNWTASSGSTIESESSEIWVVDTVTVTYSAAGWVQHKEQMPDDFNANTSRWVVGGGAAIANQSVEYLKVDYVDVSLSNASPCGFVQHKALLTDFFGENGKDGKGFVNVKAFDGDADLTEAKSYYFLQFVGKSDTSAVISEVPSDKAISWYNYSQSGHDYAGWYKNRNASGTTFK